MCDMYEWNYVYKEKLFARILTTLQLKRNIIMNVYILYW